jgi:hypothetical protein
MEVSTVVVGSSWYHDGAGHVDYDIDDHDGAGHVDHEFDAAAARHFVHVHQRPQRPRGRSRRHGGVLVLRREHSDVDLEVVRVVDDRYGTLEVPEEETILSPGETLCTADLGLPVSYTARPADAGTTIVNNAVVTVRTVGARLQAFQATDPAEVEMLAAGQQVEPTTTTLPPTGLANTGGRIGERREQVSGSPH